MHVDTFIPDTGGLDSVIYIFDPSTAMLCASCPCLNNTGATLEIRFNLSAAHGVWSSGGIYGNTSKISTQKISSMEDKAKEHQMTVFSFLVFSSDE